MRTDRLADVMIRGGIVIDGSGEPGRAADIAIEGGRVAAVGDLDGWRAEIVLSAKGLTVTPGFIDMHTHSDLALLLNPRAESKLRQGVTTEVLGQCGYSPAPAPADKRDAIRSHFGAWGQEVTWTWGSLGDYLSALRDNGTSVNVVPVIGHGIVRAGIMGEDERSPSNSDLDQMRKAVEQAVSEGAFGLSTGLIYAPGMFADTDELVALAEMLSPVGGIYFSHIRSENVALHEAIDEAIEIGRRAGVRVHISHLKAEGRANWGQTERVLATIDTARAEGVDVGFDVYPYDAWNTSLAQLLPAWARVGGAAEIIGRLTDGQTRTKLLAEIFAEAEADPGRWERRLLSSVKTNANRPLQGKTLATIAQERGCFAPEAVLDLLAEEQLDAGMVGFAMCEEDVRRVLSHPLATIGSDAASQAPYGILGEGHPHPRTYGTFVRVLGHYARDERLFSLEEGVAKMTSRAADRLGLADRGRLVPGAAADVVVFDANTVSDTATYEEPHQYAAGIRWVIVNGVIELDGEHHQDHRPGQVLTPAGR
ncbi:MAG: D-aminoacylase [Armatimonadetes bacterium]|nr:D-aminoacylase [Armatimonadota bacterium]